MTKICLKTKLNNFLVFTLVGSLLLFNSCQIQAKELNWHTNYKESIDLAKKESKPLFIYFTGSDWCGWCLKIQKEILGTPEFKELVNDKFVFVEIDFPLKKAMTPELFKQNEELKKNFKIEGVPTIILLSPEGKEIAILHYREGGGKAYAEYLLKLLEDEKNFNKSMQEVDKQSVSILKSLYEHALCRGRVQDARNILQVGLVHNDNVFFLKERYRNLLQERNLNDKEVQKVKKQLLAKDPDNAKHIHYDLAVIEFEFLSKNLRTMKSAQAATKPLQDYLALFGEKDESHRFRVEMIISQAYHFKNEVKLADHYAKASYLHAPDEHKPMIAQSIASFQQDSSDIGAAGD